MVPPILEVKNLIILPNFDGNRNELHDFLNISTTLFSHYYNTSEDGCLQNIITIINN